MRYQCAVADHRGAIVFEKSVSSRAIPMMMQPSANASGVPVNTCYAVKCGTCGKTTWQVSTLVSWGTVYVRGLDQADRDAPPGLWQTRRCGESMVLYIKCCDVGRVDNLAKGGLSAASGKLGLSD